MSNIDIVESLYEKEEEICKFMFKISGFFDEVSPKLEEQLAAMQTLGMRYLCPRNVNGKNIAQYSLQSFRQDVKPALLKQGVQLSSIGSPIGKIDLTDEKAYQAQLKQLRELLAIAQEMECAYIRVFSFFTAKAAGEDRLLERVAEKVNGFLKLAEGSGVTLIHENEKRIYGDTPEKALALYNALNHPGFALCYDASNYIQCGVDSWEAHRQTKRYTVYYHMKDCAEGIEVPLGTGEGRIPELLADLNASGYGGFLTLEPHTLQYALLKRAFRLLPFATNTRRGRVFRQIDREMGVKGLQPVSRAQVFAWQHQNLVSMLEEIGGQYE